MYKMDVGREKGPLMHGLNYALIWRWDSTEEDKKFDCRLDTFNESRKVGKLEMAFRTNENGLSLKHNLI